MEDALKKILRNAYYLLTNNFRFVKVGILIIAFLSLIFVPKKTKVLSDQSLYDFTEIHERVYTDLKNLYFFNEAERCFFIGRGSNWETIRINIDIQDLKEALTLFTTLSDMKYLAKNIKIVINFEQFIKNYMVFLQNNIRVKDLNHFKHRLLKFAKTAKNGGFPDPQKLKNINRSFKECKLSNIIKNSLFKNLEVNNVCAILYEICQYFMDFICSYFYMQILEIAEDRYFATINIKFGSNSSTIVKPLIKTQPNSDLLFICEHYFPCNINWFPRNFMPNMNDDFTVNLEVCKNIHELRNLITLVRCISNIHSHSLGTYHYIPLANSFIDVLQIVPFIILMFIYSVIESCEHYNLFKTDIIFISILLYFMPCICLIAPILCFKKRFNMSLIIGLISIKNFRIGFLVCLIYFFKNIKLVFSSKKKI
ncbi:hypothetical protein EDEG_00317 [Edhazardia aedis USNM 41457]|uniref:Uncharacterized protein n=1 Tax=Edhazardia aedis (strain USNM 41457) TaxID=1003232 RepID=J9D2A2_EDHAE|nr:hypothetical protein EDEG_00317 [Edhazardia aedis USNM 41457]|eukprot:EJW01971.1 hypothetical protein EDEG_00317 [Edhazardia aedis USNM 41457]